MAALRRRRYTYASGSARASHDRSLAGTRLISLHLTLNFVHPRSRPLQNLAALVRRGFRWRQNRSDTIQVIVELIFNLLWVVLSTGLIGLWLFSRRRWQDDVSRPGTHMQIAALAIVIVILLPVVSLTDDLLACTAPAEVEHLVRRDLLDHVDNGLHAASIMAAALVSDENASGLQIISRLTPAMEIGAPREEFLSIVGSRPPPRS